jgi:hypothetical protein
VILCERIHETGQRRVVDRLGEVVGSEVRSLDLDLDRHDEGLAHAFLVREVADMRLDGEIAQEHPVAARHPAHGRRPLVGSPVSGLSGSKA